MGIESIIGNAIFAVIVIAFLLGLNTILNRYINQTQMLIDEMNKHTDHTNEFVNKLIENKLIDDNK